MQCAHGGEELGLVLELRLPADARGVHEHELPRRRLPARVDRVHRGARRGLDEHALLAQQGVHERALAHVRPADDRDARRRGLALDLCGQDRQHRIEQVSDPEAAFRGHGVRLAQAEAVEVVHDRVAGDIHLVHHQQRLPPGAPELGGDGLVEIRNAGVRVDQEQHRVREPDRRLRLTPHVGVAARGRGGQEAARVHEHERASRPLGAHGIPVARDPRAVVRDRPALAEDAIEQRRLAHVRAADDGDDRCAHGMGASGKRNARRERRVPLVPARRGPTDGAGNGGRTRDLKLGKLALYQLSYARVGEADVRRRHRS